VNVSLTRAGFFTTVQDLGRPGYRQSGVSHGGALDGYALRIANLLVGNEASSAGIEATLGHLHLRFSDERVMAWCGGAFEVQISGTRISAGRAAVIHAGEELHAKAPGHGARAWLAISGGIDVPILLGSHSTDLRSEFGGFNGRALRDGDVLALGQLAARSHAIAKKLAAARLSSWSAPNEWANTAGVHPFLRIVRGADWARFAEASRDALMHEVFTVAAASDRMGVRLEGPRLTRVTQEDRISQAVVPGTLQVPPNGQPILLLEDCQTIGGYPKIAHVITVDLALAAQLRPGDSVRFAEVSLAEAHRELIEREREVERFRIGLTLQTS